MALATKKKIMDIIVHMEGFLPLKNKNQPVSCQLWWGLKSWTYRALIWKLVGKWFNLREWGGFMVVLVVSQGLRRWKWSIPSRNVRQVGGEMGFGNMSRTRWNAAACRCPCLWSCLGCYCLWGWGLLDPKNENPNRDWLPLYFMESNLWGFNIRQHDSVEITRLYCPGWNLASPAQKRCSAEGFVGFCRGGQCWE